MNKTLYIISETREKAGWVPIMFPQLEDAGFIIKRLGRKDILGRKWEPEDMILLHFFHIEDQEEVVEELVPRLKSRKLYLRVMNSGAFVVKSD